MERILEWGEESSSKTGIDMSNSLIVRLREFMENEARSCSMDFGCVTPMYVYRVWGGAVALEEIENGLALIKAER